MSFSQSSMSSHTESVEENFSDADLQVLEDQLKEMEFKTLRSQLFLLDATQTTEQKLRDSYEKNLNEWRELINEQEKIVEKIYEKANQLTLTQDSNAANCAAKICEVNNKRSTLLEKSKSNLSNIMRGYTVLNRTYKNKNLLFSEVSETKNEEKKEERTAVVATAGFSNLPYYSIWKMPMSTLLINATSLIQRHLFRKR